MKNTMEDKRTQERFDLEIPVELGFAGSAGERTDLVSLKTVNVCAGGAFFETENRIPPGTRIKLDMTLSIEKLKELLNSYCRIRVEGEVIRSENSGIAVRFDEEYEIIPVKEAAQ